MGEMGDTGETAIYSRVILKISGEALAGKQKSGLCMATVLDICKSIRHCAGLGVQIGVVVGGGNFWRGRTTEHMDAARADQIGMLATTMNALAIGDALESLGCDVRVQTAIEMNSLAEPYIRQKADRHLEKGRVVIFGCGTGSPFFTTDSAAALRAAELKADILLKATTVDGIYDRDPHKFDDAVKYDTINHHEILVGDLHVMDSTAAAICKDRHIPILVFSLERPDNIVDAITGKKIGTFVTTK